jgi:hypothetical protein
MLIGSHIIFEHELSNMSMYNKTNWQPNFVKVKIKKRIQMLLMFGDHIEQLDL